PNRFKFLVMRGPPASSLFASWPWPRHNWMLGRKLLIWQHTSGIVSEAYSRCMLHPSPAHNFRTHLTQASLQVFGLLCSSGKGLMGRRVRCTGETNYFRDYKRLGAIAKLATS